MSKIISIATAQPAFEYQQSEILQFMKELYEPSDEESRKLSLLYDRSGIRKRYSLIEDFKLPEAERSFYQVNSAFPNLEERMRKYFDFAPALAKSAVEKCLANVIEVKQITHLITVSCTGMAAPGLDVMLVNMMGMNLDIHRTSVNFMGCYAAIHGLKLAHDIAENNTNAHVVVVCVELCSLHFQKDNTMENIAANLLFADGAAATLITSNQNKSPGLIIESFNALLLPDGESAMAWHLSSMGFLMTLSVYIPKLIESGIASLVNNVLNKMGMTKSEINHWAIHPGGRKILEVAQKELSLDVNALDSSYKILSEFGNMSSPTILYVLKDIWESKIQNSGEKIFGIAFGPGLTMETVLLKSDF